MIFESQEEEDKIRYRFFGIKINFQFHKRYKSCLMPISPRWGEPSESPIKAGLFDFNLTNLYSCFLWEIHFENRLLAGIFDCERVTSSNLVERKIPTGPCAPPNWSSPRSQPKSKTV